MGTNKKTDLPAMPFYIGDWKKDPGIQVLTREEKWIWFEMLMLMWESEERGYLTINGKPMSISMISTALNLDNQNTSKWLTYFGELGLYSYRESDGAIFSRKIVKIVQLSEKRKKAGKQGGNPNLVNQNSTKSEAKGLANTENENENESEDESNDYEDMVLDKNGNRVSSFNGPSLNDVINFYEERHLTADDAIIFWNEYEAKQWVIKTDYGPPNYLQKTWRLKAEQWIKRNRKEQIEKTERSKSNRGNSNPGKGSIDQGKYKKLLSNPPAN